MKKLSAIAIAATAMASMTACGNNTQSQNENENTDSIKAIVIYYSQTGATKAVAEEIAARLNADIEAIEVTEPYDGSYDETIQRCMQEQTENKIPEVKPLKADLSKYDVVFLGYPVWFGTYARPIMGLIETNDFAGKKIVPFSTFGSGGIDETTEQLRKALPKAEVADGYGVRNARVQDAPKEIEYFLIANGYLPGEVAPMAEFSETKDVDDNDKAVFDAACSDYVFPLGTPVKVASRKIINGTEYRFTAESTAPDGTASQSTVYVVAPATETDVKPYFTKVVR